MRQPKIDVSNCQILGLYAEPKRANPETGEIPTDAEGNPKYNVHAFISDGEGDSGTVRITVPSSSPIEIEAGKPAQFENLRVMGWSMGNRGGMAWLADSVTQQPAASAGRSRGGSDE